jgi:hypothetical protein
LNAQVIDVFDATVRQRGATARRYAARYPKEQRVKALNGLFPPLRGALKVTNPLG